MKIVETVKITSTTDLIYIKITLKNYLKRYKVKNLDILILGVMEIGTNILKHAKDGEIWILDEDGYLAIVGLDCGDGIKNISWAIQKGTSSLSDSLGVGLYALHTNKLYNFEIFSITKEDSSRSGTIVGLFNKSGDIYLNLPLYAPYSGDFYLQKEKYAFFGDIAGHGITAYKSLKTIENLFLKTSFVCSNIEPFFQTLNLALKEKRGCVGAILYEDNEFYTICGVGNLSIFYKNEKIKSLNLSNGVVGEVFSKTKTLKLKKNAILIITSDGIEEKLIFEFLKLNISTYMMAFCAVWFCGVNDDRSILIKGA